ncbi:hypothetical protein HQ563_10455 [bacterium]|nr:hypothetical protein [bacterium]
MLTVVRWIHLSSMAVLVGGMSFVFFVLRPALSRHAEEPAMKPVSSFIGTRFRWVAVLLTAVIVASGIVNIIIAPPRGWYILLLVVKVVLAAGVLSLYFRNAFAKIPGADVPEPSPLPPADAPGVSPPEKPSEWKTAWLLTPTVLQVKIELALIAVALLVILLGVILAQS